MLRENAHPGELALSARCVTVKLITAALREMARDPKVGRAEAMRRSMTVLIENGDPHEAHPAFWAPFVVVGEGAAPSALCAARQATGKMMQ